MQRDYWRAKWGRWQISFTTPPDGSPVNCYGWDQCNYQKRKQTSPCHLSRRRKLSGSRMSQSPHQILWTRLSSLGAEWIFLEFCNELLSNELDKFMIALPFPKNTKCSLRTCYSRPFQVYPYENSLIGSFREKRNRWFAYGVMAGFTRQVSDWCWPNGWSQGKQNTLAKDVARLTD